MDNHDANNLHEGGSIDRRDFLQRLAVVPASIALTGAALGAAETGPVGPVAVPDSAKPSAKRLGYKRLCLDFHFSEYPEGVLSKADAKQYIGTLKENGGEVVLAFAKDHWGNHYYDTVLGHKHPALKQDLFGRIVAEAEQQGIEVIAYTSIGWDEFNRRRHPDWCMVSWQGVSRHHAGKWTTLCVNSDYGRHTIEHIAELCGKYRFRGIWIDIVQYSFSANAPCYCAACQRLWREAGHGDGIPNPLDGEMRARYLDFRDGFLRRYVAAARDAAKTAQPGVLFTHNWGGSFDLDDFIPKEAEPWGKDYVYQGYMTKYTRALAKDRDFEMYSARFNQSCDFTIKPVELMCWEAASIIAHNGAIEIVDQPNVDGTLEPKAWKVIREAYRTIDELSPHLTGTRPFVEIGVLYSHRNWELHLELGGESVPGVAHDFAGACKLFADEHLPYDVIVEENLTPALLRSMRVIVVPNTVSLYPKTVQYLRDWCREGGLLVFDYRTASQDHRGRSVNPGFGMVEPLDDYPANVSFVKPAFDLDNPYLRVSGIARFQAESKAAPLGFLTPPAIEETSERWVSHKIHPGTPTSTPAAVLGSFGNGAYVYYSWRLFKELLATDLRTIRHFVRRSLEKHYEPALTVESPRTVEMIPYRTRGGYRVFLTNAVVGRPAGPCTPTYGANPAPHINLDFILPVHDVQVRVRSEVQRARDMHGRPLDVSHDGVCWRITVPKVEQYQVVDIETVS